jgi:hypothetical protein
MAKSKAMSKEKKHVGFHPKNFACRRSVRKVLASVLWIKDRAIYTDYVQQAKSITTEYYCFLLTKLQAKIVETRLGKLSKGVLFLQDNTPAPKSPVAPQEINEIGFKSVDHPIYSSDFVQLKEV